MADVFRTTPVPKGKLMPTGQAGATTGAVFTTSTVSVPEEEAVPPGVVIRTTPEVAPWGTTKVTVWLSTLAKLEAVVPPTETEVAPPRSVPVTVTAVPGAALEGVKERIAGGLAAARVREKTEPAWLETPLAIRAESASAVPVEPDLMRIPTGACCTVMLVREILRKSIPAMPPMLEKRMAA